MFRRLSSSLPKDPTFPADLTELGYFLNEKDQLRSIERPDQEFNYFISKNERVNDVHREAFNTCTRSILSQRFTSLSLNTTRLPLNTPPTSPHVPILTSTNISTARRIILYVGEETQDLGIFAYRTIGHESLAAGSVQAFVSAVQSSPDELGVIIANPGQLLWYRRGCRAVTRSSWLALPRKNGVSDAFRIDPVKNRIPENEDMAAHVRYIFEHVITDMTTPDAQIDIIGLSEGAAETVEFLQANWDVWRNRIHAVAIGAGYAWPGSEIYNKDFAVFWAKRARAYLLSPDPVGTPLSGRESFLCNCYSAGTETYIECIMPASHKAMLAFFKLVADVPGFEEMEFGGPPDLTGKVAFDV